MCLNTVRVNNVYIDYIFSIYPNGIQTPYNRIPLGLIMYI